VRAQPFNILILNVTTIFAQMHRDPIGSAQVGFHSGPDRIRVDAAPGLAQGRHMVNVYAKFNHAKDPSMGRNGILSAR
jgi:hypothetical protein